MPRLVRCGLIQARNAKGPEAGLPAIKKAMLDKHVKLIEQAARRRCRSSACRSCSTGPTSAPSRRRVVPPHGAGARRAHRRRLMRKLAKKHTHGDRGARSTRRSRPGVYYNTAAVIDADGKLPGQVPQDPHPALQAGLLGEVLLPARQPGLPGVRDRATPRSASTSATTGTSPRARALGPERRRDRLQPVGHRGRPVRVPVGARAARARGRQRLLRRARSTASATRRPGRSASSTARATSATRAARSSRRARATRTRCVVADLNLDMIEEVRSVWQFYRDRRPDAYGELVQP